MRMASAVLLFHAVIGDHLLNSGTFPIDGVIALLYMHRDSILVITSSYCLSVLSQSNL